MGTVIADGQGFTLYHLKTEVNGKIMCTGSCTGVWPPLLVTSGSVRSDGVDDFSQRTLDMSTLTVSDSGGIVRGGSYADE